VSLFGLEAIVQANNPLLHLIEQAGRFQRRSAELHEEFTPVRTYNLLVDWLCCKRLAGFFDKKCIVNGQMYRPAFADFIALDGVNTIT
jgi:hypothetical protein